MLWEVEIRPAPTEPDRSAGRLEAEALLAGLQVATARGYLLEGDLSAPSAQQATLTLLADPIVEVAQMATPDDPQLAASALAGAQLVYVLPKPGVMDPVAESARQALADLGVDVGLVRTFRKYWLAGIDPAAAQRLAGRLLANDAIEQVVWGQLPFTRLELGSPYHFELVTVPIRDADDDRLVEISRSGQLSLSLEEMRTIQAHFRELQREPTDCELETLAQTWSEHCSHKTLAGRIRYRDDQGERSFTNMLKETIFAATQQLRGQWGNDDWCVSVFKDNAGVVTFDDEYHVVFKVETHNHPSAIEPYGGANTGLGGVIRDPLGTGLGAKPVCSTDVFCFAPPDTPPELIPPGVLDPKRVLEGVVAGVRDYGNRMGIPTVNGAVYFDARYLANPLVYCGNVGLIPVDRVEKHVAPGDLIVTLGGRTGRDGIHGATFSSLELTHESESISGGAVQIGNAITEKMLADVLLQARDRGLYRAVTDCGAGGFSSAVGEMGAEVGADVDLDAAPLKYEGLSYTEIWISEAQERMVLAVPPEHWDALQALCASEDVEATVIGTFVNTGKLTLRYQGQQVGQLDMAFLHDGRPPVVRDAVFTPPNVQPLGTRERERPDETDTLLKILAAPNVASKEWIIRQYDHEVQGGSVIKPLVGVHEDGPSDAAVVRPRIESRRGLVVSCGMNPHYGDYDPYHMAASAIDEAVRNCVAVGADPRRIAILDNFCWGNTARPETLGSLVRAALACYDVAVGLGTPFISGKDSLNNEYRGTSESGRPLTITIPPSLLISALGQIEDVARAVTMDLKTAGNVLFQIGITRDELGGSHYSLVHGLDGGQVPRLDVATARRTFFAMHQAIDQGLVRACHDLSEGGLAVAAAEMAFAGGLGLELDLAHARVEGLADGDPHRDIVALFSESNSRFLCEVPVERAEAFAAIFQQADVACVELGRLTEQPRLVIHASVPQGPDDQPARYAVIDAELATLKHAWQETLRL